MIGSSQHELAKWFAEIFALVLKLYSSHCVKDSLTFANFIQNCNLEPAKTFLCSFDISSLFTSVPLDETVEICADALYRGHLDCPTIPEDTFRELMLIATQGVEFSFNNKMYNQLDGVAMGSTLGPALANIFVGFHESRHGRPSFSTKDNTCTVVAILLKQLNCIYQCKITVSL